MKRFPLLLLGGLLAFNFLALPIPVDAQAGDFFGVNFQQNAGLGRQDPRETISSLIRIIMGFLGTVAVVIILMGGFKWMLAGGNQDKVDEARKLITAGIIGLVIILSAFAITTFVLDQLTQATGVTG